MTENDFLEENAYPSYYSITPAPVRYDTDLTPNAKLLYGEITCLANKAGYSFARNSYFSKLYNVTPQAISKWVTQLKNKGYIIVEYIYEGKEIKERRIYPNGPAFNKNMAPINTEFRGVSTTGLEGYQQKIKDNITSINNINSNINSYPDGLTEKKEDKKSSETSDSLFPDFPDDVPRETKKKSKKKNTNLKDDDFYKPIYDQYREVFFSNFSGIPNCGKYKDFTDKCISKFRDQGYNDEQIQQFIILAIKNAASDKFCMSKRLPFAMIVSDTVMPRLVDSKTNDSPSFGVDFNGQNYSEVF